MEPREPRYILSCHAAKNLKVASQVLAPAHPYCRATAGASCLTRCMKKTHIGRPLHWKGSPFQGCSLSTNVLVYSVSKYPLRPCHVPAILPMGVTVQVWPCRLLGLIPWRCDVIALGCHVYFRGNRCMFLFIILLVISSFIYLTDKATDPSMSEQDWSAIQNFCDQVNTDPSG